MHLVAQLPLVVKGLLIQVEEELGKSETAVHAKKIILLGSLHILIFNNFKAQETWLLTFTS